MNTCDTCKHWKEEPTQVYKKCNMIRADFEDGKDCRTYNYWDTPENEAMKREMKEKNDLTNKAYVKDGSDYIADLFTKKDFGCILWEIKEK